ncbi:MAG: translation elongation factor EF-1 subunit alpha [Aeropyrum sp.]|nr:translation elongation factor EF-1 subunit alpha [Aeropyrum sp.]MCE4616673.1 translation elongation factor EF-1 subunit alpha [Aeropyrum sp.]
MAEKQHLNLVVIGHVDHGKSTLVGHLLYRLGYIEDKKLKELEEQAKSRGKESFKFAWILDKMKEERERGITIDLTFMKFETKKYIFTIIDAPGHRDFIKNMITGASQADAAILVVSARKGEFEAGMSAEGQTREHLLLARTMGIEQIIVAVNKMDAPDVNYDQKRYEFIVGVLKKFMKGLGYQADKIPFIPVSAWKGDNLIERSPNMPWYNGPTLVEALDQLQPPKKPVDKPLRIPIQNVYSIPGAGTVPVGRVETGVLRVGDKVVFMPAGVTGEVRSIEMHYQQLQQAEPGDNIGFAVRGVGKGEIKRGDVAGHPDKPPTVADEFEARIFVIWHPSAITVGYTPVIHIHTASISSRIIQIKAKLDPKTGQVVEENPQFLKSGDAAIVVFKPIKPMVVETFSEIPQLGRFAMRDMNRTVGIGIVTSVKPAKIDIRTK